MKKDENMIWAECEECGASIGNPNLATKTKTGLRCFRCDLK